MTAPVIRCGQRYTHRATGEVLTLDAADGDWLRLDGPRGRSRELSAAQLLRDFTLVDDALDFGDVMHRSPTTAQARRSA